MIDAPAQPTATAAETQEQAEARLDAERPALEQHGHLTATGGSGPLYLYTPSGASINLDGWYRGRACFLCCGGPSLADANLALLNTPGVVTWGLNNSWAVTRPRFWTCVDPPGRFHDRGWRDPAITKVVPLALANHRLRWRDATGKFHPSGLRVRDCPAVLFFNRSSRFEPADFFAEPAVCWGNDDHASDSLGIKGGRSVMLATIRLIHALGFRTLYLLGCDFRMQEGGQNYAFPQERDRHACRHNNSLFHALSKRFEALKPYMALEGFEVFNTTPNSALEAFPFVRLSDAVDRATVDCRGAMQTEGWYSTPPNVREQTRALWDHGGGD